MEERCKISVITVSYNAEKNIEKTIVSVLSQLYENIEYIIIDGGSKDRTNEIILKYKDRISIYVSEPDKGLYDAMNKGIKMASGNWICFMNVGDMFESSKTLYDIFEGKNYDGVSVLYGDVVIDYSPYGFVLKRMNKLEGRRKATDICHQSTFTRTSCLKNTPYDLSYRVFADMNAFYTFWRKGEVFKYIDKPIAVFEGFDGISSNSPILTFKEYNRMLSRKWYNSISWWRSLIRLLMRVVYFNVTPKNSLKSRKFQRILAQNEEYKVKIE